MLNRPSVRNALSEEMIRELLEVFLAVKDRKDIRGISIRGAGGAFCAGGDLKDFKKLFKDEKNLEAARSLSMNAGEFFEIIQNLPQVVVTLVDGAAFARGLGIISASDIVVVTKNAKFSISETSVGLVPAQIAPFVMKRIGLSMARYLMLTGLRFSGQRALSIGLANLLVEDGELDEALRQIKADVNSCAPGANRSTKMILMKSSNLEGLEMRKFAANKFAKSIIGNEAQEGLKAFAEKRKPGWAK